MELIERKTMRRAVSDKPIVAVWNDGYLRLSMSAMDLLGKPTRVAVGTHTKFAVNPVNGHRVEFKELYIGGVNEGGYKLTSNATLSCKSLIAFVKEFFEVAVPVKLEISRTECVVFEGVKMFKITLKQG